MSPEEEKQARYDEMKNIKQAQREAREAEKKNPELAAKKGPSFWDKEAERSGLNGNRVGNFFHNLNPVPFFKDQTEKYKARKAASSAGNASDRARSVASANSAVAVTGAN